MMVNKKFIPVECQSYIDFQSNWVCLQGQSVELGEQLKSICIGYENL